MVNRFEYKGEWVSEEEFRIKMGLELPKKEFILEEDMTPIDEVPHVDPPHISAPMEYKMEYDKSDSKVANAHGHEWKEIIREYSEVDVMLISEQMKTWELLFKNVLWVPRNNIMDFCVKIGMFPKRQGKGCNKEWMVKRLREILSNGTEKL